MFHSIHNYEEDKMYKKVLVPLDGSELAECVLPHVVNLARGSHVEQVILFSVMDHMAGHVSEEQEMPFPQGVSAQATAEYLGTGPVQAVTPAEERRMEEVQRYLDSVAASLREQDVLNIRTETSLGNPAEEIAKFADSGGADIIVMSSHGRSGPSRWAFGSVADKVFRASCIPVLMVRAPGCTPGV